MALCKACTKAFSVRIRWGKRPRGRPLLHHSTVKSFLASVDGGCYICSRVFAGLPAHLQARVRTQAALHEAEREDKGGGGGGGGGRGARAAGGRRHRGIAIRMDYSRPDGVGFTFGSGAVGLEDVCSGVYFTLIPLGAKLDVLLKPRAARHLPSSLTRRVTSSSTASEETFSKIRGWLENCESAHALCGERRRQQKLNWYPTRLVDVGPSRQDDGVTENISACKITHSKDIPPGHQYITLSHRWGEGNNIAKLTLENLEAWTSQIPTEVLPQTFRDALVVARRCGIPYVWIDSLCIIQNGDGNEDWEREAPTMQEVYSNAAFNICASWSEDTGGLFSERTPADVEYPQIYIRRSRRRGLRFFGSPRTMRSAFLIVDRDAWWDQVDDSPLSRRGWVFQERLLSLRNVHFCARQVFFECGEHRGSEALGLGMNYHRTDREPKHDIYKQLLAGTADKAAEKKTIGYLWEEVVSSYSACHLTYRADRLIAISGVAQRFKPLLGDVYIAGLWLGRLPFDMLWRNEEQLQVASSSDSSSRHRSDQHSCLFTFSWICGGAVWTGGHNAERGRAEHILPEVACVKYRTSRARHTIASGDFDDEPFSQDIFSLPAAPAVEIRVAGTLKRMAFRRRRDNTYYAVPLGVCPPPPPSSSSPSRSGPHHHAGERDDADENEHGGDDDDDIADRQCTVNLDRPLPETEMARLARERRLFYIPWYDASLPQSGSGSGSAGGLECLLLELIDEDMARFRRLGLLYASCVWWPAAGAAAGKGRGKRGMRDVFLASQADEDRLPCWRYDGRTKRHTVYIV